MERSFLSLVKSLVSSWTSVPVEFSLPERSATCRYCAHCGGSALQPRMVDATAPCRQPLHHPYWDLYDQLKDNDLI